MVRQEVAYPRNNRLSHFVLLCLQRHLALNAVSRCSKQFPLHALDFLKNSSVTELGHAEHPVCLLQLPPQDLQLSQHGFMQTEELLDVLVSLCLQMRHLLDAVVKKLP